MIAKVRSLVAGIFRRNRVEQEMSNELQFHIDSRMEDLMAGAGCSREEAYRRARAEFGSTEKYKEEARHARGLRLLDEVRADLRYAFRTMRKSPAFTFAAIATLALGIGANTAVFSVVNAVMLKKLPVRNPDELVAFDWIGPRAAMVAGYSGSGRPDPASGQIIRTSFSYSTFDGIRQHNRTMSDIFAYARQSGGGNGFNFVADGEAEVLSGQLVTGEYFKGLGISAPVGRMILPIDDAAGADPVAVISDRYWKRRFNGSESVVGKRVAINGLSTTIVGVTPPEFFGTRFGESPDISIPMAMETRLRPDGKSTEAWIWWVEIMGRMNPDVSREQVAADISGIFADSVRGSWESRPPDRRTAQFQARTAMPQLRVLSGNRGPDGLPPTVPQILSITFSIVGLILLIVCANLANLFLARASTRRHEISIRLAIGADRSRLVRQLLTESVLLALLGGVLGTIFAYWGKDFLRWISDTNSLIFDSQIDARVLLFTFAVSIVTGIIFGVAPGLRATKIDLSPAMRTTASKGGSTRSLVGRSILVAQVSIAVVLLISAALFIGTLQNLRKVDIGFNPANLILFDVGLQTSDPAARVRLFEDMIQELQQIPGVQSATLSSMRPISDSARTEDVTISTPSENGPGVSVYVQAVRSNFFETMEMPLLRGRGLSPADRSSAPEVAVINQAMAKRLLAESDPIGRQFRFVGPADAKPIEIVGVVRDAKYESVYRDAPPTVYLSYLQAPSGAATFEARVDSNLPLSRPQTQVDQISENIGAQRMFAILSGVFSTVGLLLVCIGLYGIVSYSVNQRINEIGIRMALGARRADVVRLVMKETWWMLLIGGAIGVGAGSAAMTFIAGMLYGVAPYDPMAMASAVIVMCAVAMLASYLPARRASRVDPITALRSE